MNIKDYITALSSNSPTPGGGGSSAIFGALGTALCSMVASLTSGKKKYAIFQEDYDRIILDTKNIISRFLELMLEDEKVFEPLSRAYSIPKDAQGRDTIMEDALNNAASVPIEIMRLGYSSIDILEEVLEKGTPLAISDVGVAATAIRACIEGAAMNVYINTKFMNNRDNAIMLDNEANMIVKKGSKRCNDIYHKVVERMM